MHRREKIDKVPPRASTEISPKKHAAWVQTTMTPNRNAQKIDKVPPKASTEISPKKHAAWVETARRKGRTSASDLQRKCMALTQLGHGHESSSKIIQDIACESKCSPCASDVLETEHWNLNGSSNLLSLKFMYRCTWLQCWLPKFYFN